LTRDISSARGQLHAVNDRSTTSPTRAAVERHTMPDGTVVITLPPRGARRIVLADFSSFVLVIGLAAFFVWGTWYASWPSLAWGAGVFALIAAAAAIRCAMHVRADRAGGTRVDVDKRSLRVADLGRHHAWDLVEICHVAAGSDVRTAPRLLVRTVDRLDEVISYRTLGELRALADEIARLLPQHPPAGAPSPAGGRVLDYSAHPPGNRLTLTHGADGETIILLRPHGVWRRLAGPLPGATVIIVVLVTVALLDQANPLLQRVLVRTLLGLFVLAVIAGVVWHVRNDPEKTIRINGARLSVTGPGRQKREWHWSQIADVGVAPNPNDDSSTPCLLIRLDERIEVLLGGEGELELEWIAGVIRRARPAALPATTARSAAGLG
jgi:hypothetical protein